MNSRHEGPSKERLPASAGSRGPLLWGLLALVFALAPPVEVAMAQGSTAIDIEQFQTLPAPEENLLSVASSRTLEHMHLSVGNLLHVSGGRLTQILPGGADRALVGTAFRNEFSVAMGFYGFAEAGIVLPIDVYETGGDLAVLGLPGQNVQGSHLADPRLVAKIVFPESWRRQGFSAGLLAILYAPLGDSGAFNSAGKVRFEPRAIVDWLHPSGVRLAFNVGYQKRPSHQAVNYVSDDAIRWGLAGEAPTGVEDLTGILSLFGERQLAKNRNFANLFQPRDDGKGEPTEIQAGARYKISPRWTAVGAVGAGLTRGVGAPSWRVVLGISAHLSPEDMAPTDADGDGIFFGPFDLSDGCPNTPEDFDGFEDNDGCPEPDNDRDGIQDIYDKCPRAREDKDGFQDEDGCPDPDNDKDGVLDVDDECPLVGAGPDGFVNENGCPDPDQDADGVPDASDPCPIEAEDRDGFQDEDGCPDLDNDRDGFLDADDKCPMDPEIINNIEDEDGCPEKGTRMEISVDEAVMLPPLRFSPGDSALALGNGPVLKEIAELLQAHPEIKRMEIGGHTDSRGTPEYNQKLSVQRAEAVRQALIRLGVEPARLEVKGYGEDKPIAPNKTPSGRSINRRVDLRITVLEKITDAPPPRIPESAPVPEEPAP